MELHSETGDIVELAPNLCNMMVLWLRGAGRRFATWQAIQQRYPKMELLAPALDAERPWLNHEGATFKLRPADERLRYIHVLPNMKDAVGLRSLGAVGTVVGKALNVANGIGANRVSRVGFINIPVFFGGRVPTAEHYRQSAIAMIGALKGWDAAHTNSIKRAYLVDLDGGFEPFIPKEPHLPPPE